MRVGIVGAGNIAFVSAGWLAMNGHQVAMWSRSNSVADLATTNMQVIGLSEGTGKVGVAATAADLAADAEVILIAIPVASHRAVMDALLPHLTNAHTVIVSSMSSLSGLYLYEGARQRGLDISVAGFGTTVMTGRRVGNTTARITGRRKKIGVSALPVARTEAMVALCQSLFGDGFVPEQNVLGSTLTNINPIAHAPLTVYNWTRIERAEVWSQYYYMSPRVSAVIEKLDAERLAIAAAFGLTVRTVEQHFLESFAAEATTMAGIAAEMHEKRSAIAGPVDMNTGYFSSDIPYGLVFNEELGKRLGIATPVSTAMIDAASLITGKEFRSLNDLLEPLRISSETLAGIKRRVEV